MTVVNSDKELAKYIYEYSNRTDFDAKKENELCERLAITRGEYSEYLLNYFYNVLGYSRDKSRTFMKEINLKRKKSRDFYGKISVDIKNYNPALLEKGIMVKKLWRTTEEKDLVAEYIFYYCQKNGIALGWRELAVKFGVSKFRIEDLYNYYRVKLEIDNPKKYMELMEQKNTLRAKKCRETAIEKYGEPDSVVVLKKLLAANSFEQAVMILQTTSYSPYYLKHMVYSFSTRYDNKDDVFNKLMGIIDRYVKLIVDKKVEKIESKKEEKRQELTLKSEELIISFIDSDLQLAEFCALNGITKKQLNKYLKVILQNDPELYHKYDEKIKEEALRKLSDDHQKILQLVNFIKFGIGDNEEKRPFDILDYYLLIGMNIRTLQRKLSNFLPLDDLLEVHAFFNRNESFTFEDKMFARYILKTTVVLNTQIDAEGNLIPGTGEVIPEELKIKIIQFLQKNNIPINAKTYDLVFRRYLVNQLSLESEEEMTRKLVTESVE